MTAAADHDEAVDLEDIRRMARNLVTYAKYVEEHLKAGRLDSAEWWLGHVVDEANRARAAAREGIERAREVAAAGLEAAATGHR